ncbi:hydroxymethylpyrimidine/phosphomethylpyrimidine kinase [Galbibacter sp. EGI 63066]|uniref:hydroxymethylpyrimidine/phosphomethylpyrimidine kinase n=1 Tax=Galbibacter sp. EGI 63066 TaxID=2993559 RepID=UPI0022494EAD|nr:hydroxymethylpyrimidine/phosphomethylpyrimidine kinase [Galbibacter sp. EGI 63066]MCX2678866.1 hydroxymethylpyrimidine/phosphomethylpyrimidine kinase [Galbibacter sp. EGI 63066]
MCTDKPVVMSIAGFDPSGGAGILADCKTFEAIGVPGIAVNTANTIQTDVAFETCEWLSDDMVMQQLEMLLNRFSVSVVKIGIVQHLSLLQELVQLIKEKSPECKIVWDPVLKASTGFDFHSSAPISKEIHQLLPDIDLVVPNYEEVKAFSEENTVAGGVKAITRCSHLYLKGGHRKDRLGEDELFLGTSDKTILKPSRNDCTKKHGSGCVLSAAIAAYYYLTKDWEESCRKAKTYTENFLASTPTLIGKHLCKI